MSADPLRVPTTNASVPAPGVAAAAPDRCANCGTLLAGKYCGACGQRAEHSVHSLSFFLTEAFEDLTHADSRLWRTLWSLIARPGYLTTEFLDGRRARYLPPVRLYLVLSVVFFLVTSMAPSAGVLVVVTNDNGRPLSAKSETLDQALGALAKKNETPEEQAERLCKLGKADTLQVPFEGALKRFLGPQRLESLCRRVVLDNGRSLSEGLVHNVPRAMFLFLPLIALVMKLLYSRPRRYYVEHLLFLLHNHSFVFLIFGLCLVIRLLPLGGAASLLFPAAILYCVWYLYRAMRRVYGERRLRTAAKYGALGLTYAVSAGLMLSLTAAYSFLTLAPGS
jgi:hypothetical protein